MCLRNVILIIFILIFADPVQKVILASSNLQKSVDYWHGLLGLKLYSRESDTAVVGFDDAQAKLELKDIGT